jgi:hypothetical protein
MIHMHTILHDIVQLSNPSPCSPFSLLPFFLTSLAMNYPFNLLGNPLFGDRGANVHPTRPWLMTDCPPLAPHPPFPLPTVPLVHFTCFQRRHHNICYIVWYSYVNCKLTWLIAWKWNILEFITAYVHQPVRLFSVQGNSNGGPSQSETRNTV